MTQSADTALTIWLTGLSSAGKSTIARSVCEHLRAQSHRVEWLDGDLIRQRLSLGLGYNRHDRDENIRRIGFVAELLVCNGVIVVVSAISPYRATRDEMRALLPNFLEVYVNAPLALCEERDHKDIYRRARAGELEHVTGIDDAYEPPLSAEVECRTGQETVEQSVAKVLAAVERKLGSASI